MESTFFLYKGIWIDKCNISHSNRLSKKECRLILNGGGKIVRNIYNWDKKEITKFWYVIKDDFGGIDELPTKVRNQVRKSLKTYDFKIVSCSEMLNVGCELFNKSRERFTNIPPITQEQWKKRIKMDKDSDFWIGYDRESGKPASFAINTIFEDYVDYSTMGISPDFPNNTYPMYGLIFEMNRYYLEEKKVSFVCDGARSITEHSNIQTVLEEKFKFRKAYCDIQVFYKWWMGIAVSLLFPFRRFIGHSQVSATLRQEAWARGLEK